MTPTVSARTPSKAAIGLALAAVFLLWGSTYYAIKLALPDYPPFLLSAVRMFIAGVLMLAVLSSRGAAWPKKSQWPSIIFLALLMTAIANAAVNYAEVHVSSGMAAIAVAAMPLWAAVFGWMKNHAPNRREWVGLLIGFVGVIVLNVGSELRGNTQGMIALLVAPIAWAYASIWSKGKDLPEPFMLAATQMVVGSVWALLIALITGERFEHVPTLQPTLAMLYLVFAGSIFGFTAYIWLLHHVRPALATCYAYVNPPIAVLLGVFLLNERFSAQDMIAMAIILFGVVLITYKRA
jgi:drug/metabolite transporter (DMT)-like permease